MEKKELKKDVKKTETKPAKATKTVAEVKHSEAAMSAGERVFHWLAPEPDWKGNLRVWGKRLAKTAIGGLLVGGAYALGKSSGGREEGESATTSEEPYEAPTEE